VKRLTTAYRVILSNEPTLVKAHRVALRRWYRCLRGEGVSREESRADVVELGMEWRRDVIRIRGMSSKKRRNAAYEHHRDQVASVMQLLCERPVRPAKPAGLIPELIRIEVTV
jgi:hypothetical protein